MEKEKEEESKKKNAVGRCWDCRFYDYEHRWCCSMDSEFFGKSCDDGEMAPCKRFLGWGRESPCYVKED